VRLTTSSCKKKFVENLLRKTNLRKGQSSMGCGATDVDDCDVVSDYTVCSFLKNTRLFIHIITIYYFLD
jgi:hypothetical protein